MSETHTHSDQPNKSGKGMGMSQQAEAEDRAAWEGMTDMPPQQTGSSIGRRLFNRARDLADRGVGVLRRVIKSRN